MRSLNGRNVPEITAGALAVLILLSGWLGFRFLDQTEWVKHSLVVQTKLSQVWSLAQDAELAERGYVITGDESLLEPLSKVGQRLDEKTGELRELLADNPSQTAAVVASIAMLRQRLVTLDQIVNVRRSGDAASASSQIGDDHRKGSFQALRDSFADICKQEQQLLDKRLASERTTVAILSIAITTSVLGTMAVLFGWITQQRRSSTELEAANVVLTQTIQEREAAEVQLRQMQKMEAVGQLTGGIAHDFNNMLAVMMGAINLARRRLAKGEDITPLLQSAQDSAERAADLVRRLLAFSRQQPLAPSVIDANRFVSSMSELVSRTLGTSIKMETVLGGGLWTTRADHTQLENALLNLCVNARDAMPDGGCLTVETANCHLDDAYSRLHPGVPAGQYVLIAVTDTGGGMSPDVKARAFEPFFTTKSVNKGTGLGLSQVFGFVRQSGGHVKIYSEPGEGTTIKLYLPRNYEGEADTMRVPGVSVPTPTGTETILLVDDESAVLAVTAAGLRDLGYTVTEAGGPKTALAKFENGERFDLLLTDIVMPEINGRKLADAALRHQPNLKILFMTGFTKNAVVHNGVVDQGVHFLAKPFSIEELSHKLRQVFDTEEVGDTKK